MSKVQLAGNASGTGIFTIASPNSNTDRTLTLPDSAGTLAVQGGTGVGKILQVVQATYATQVSTSSGTPITTGLTVTITPSSSTSKILALVNNPMRRSGGSYTGIGVWLYRNGSSIYSPMSNMFYSNPSTADTSVIAAFHYLDSPASTSALTYAMYFASNGGTVYAQIDSVNNTSSMILLEVAA